MPTLRSIMKTGQKGQFAKALYELHERATLPRVIRAYQAADKPNQLLLEQWFVCHAFDLKHWLGKFWLALASLDVEMEDPYAHKLTEPVQKGGETDG